MGDRDGHRQAGTGYSLDVNANSSYDAAHLYLTHVVRNPGCGMPKPDASTLFEITTEGKVLYVEGQKLKKWIERRRIDWNGPRGYLFRSVQCWSSLADVKKIGPTLQRQALGTSLMCP